MAEQFLPVLITLGAAVFTAVAFLGLAALVAQRSRHNAVTKRETYESVLQSISWIDKSKFPRRSSE